jgi:hypothetical protein
MTWYVECLLLAVSCLMHCNIVVCGSKASERQKPTHRRHFRFPFHHLSRGPAYINLRETSDADVCLENDAHVGGDPIFNG